MTAEPMPYSPPTGTVDLDLTVAPLRWSANPAAMVEFLRVIGLSVELASDAGGYTMFRAGGGGRVLIHRCEPNSLEIQETHLCLAVHTVSEAAEAFEAAGLAVRTWDETWGLQGALVGPHGESIALNETHQDLYGYHSPQNEPEPDPRVRVSAVRASAAGAEREADLILAQALGFQPVGYADEHWAQATRPGGGTIGLHAPHAMTPVSRPGEEPYGDPALVNLGLETSGDLHELCERLQTAGYRAELCTEPVTNIVVHDPDGKRMEIHPVPDAEKN